jgi:hypothetical protein
MKIAWMIAPAILCLVGCADHDNDTVSPPTSTPDSTQSTPVTPPDAPTPASDDAALPPSPQAADAAAAAPECKDTTMKDQACKPGETGNPAKRD